MSLKDTVNSEDRRRSIVIEYSDSGFISFSRHGFLLVNASSSGLMRFAKLRYFCVCEDKACDRPDSMVAYIQCWMRHATGSMPKSNSIDATKYIVLGTRLAAEILVLS